MAGLVGKGQAKVLVVPPPDEGVFRAWNRWSADLAVRLVGHTSFERAVVDHNPACVVFCGRAELDRVIDKSVLWGRAIYHLGAINQVLRSEVQAARINAYLGYRTGPVFYLDIRDGLEPAFGDALLCGLHSIARGSPIGKARDHSTRAWHELAVRLQPSSPAVSAIARMNREDLLLLGDPSWRLPIAPEMLILGRAATPQKWPRIEIVSITPALVNWLNEDPRRLAQLTPHKFEDLVAERLAASGLQVVKTGNTYKKDGGIDLLAYPDKGPVRFLLAAQVKHSRAGQAIGPAVVRELKGAMGTLPVDVGMIVTNTRFTVDAKWVAKQLPTIIRLRGFEHLKTWLRGEIAALAPDDLPSVVNLAPGIRVPIPRTFDLDQERG